MITQLAASSVCVCVFVCVEVFLNMILQIDQGHPEKRNMLVTMLYVKLETTRKQEEEGQQETSKSSVPVSDELTALKVNKILVCLFFLHSLKEDLSWTRWPHKKKG